MPSFKDILLPAPLDHEAYPGKYRCRGGAIAIVEMVAGNYCTGYIVAAKPITQWWALEGWIALDEDGKPKQLPYDLMQRLPDPIPVRVRNALRRWWRGK